MNWLHEMLHIYIIAYAFWWHSNMHKTDSHMCAYALMQYHIFQSVWRHVYTHRSTVYEESDSDLQYMFSFQDDMVTLNFSITESDVSISCKLCAHWYRTAHADRVFCEAFLLDSLIRTMYITLEGFSNYRKKNNEDSSQALYS